MSFSAPIEFVKPLAAILCLILSGCIPKAIIVEPIAPAVTEAKGKVAAASASAYRTHRGATETAQRVGAVREGIEGAITHAESVRASKAPGTPEASEWEEQWKLLTDARTRNLFAEASATATLSQSKEAQILAGEASESLTVLETHAKQTDSNTSKITSENAKLAPDAATWRGIKKAAWTIGILGAIAVLILWGIPLARKAFLP